MSFESSTYETLDKPVLIGRITDLEQEVEKLRLRIINSNKKLYGSKTEKLTTSAQTLLDFELPPVVEIPVK